jgi:hypothetical protein
VSSQNPDVNHPAHAALAKDFGPGSIVMMPRQLGSTSAAAALEAIASSTKKAKGKFDFKPAAPDASGTKPGKQKDLSRRSVTAERNRWIAVTSSSSTASATRPCRPRTLKSLASSAGNGLHMLLFLPHETAPSPQPLATS